MMIVMNVTFTVKVTRRLMILCSFVFSKHFLQVCEHCIQKKIKQVADNKHRFLVSTSKWQIISIVSLCLQVANNKHCFLESANTHCICELVLPAPGVNSDCICRQVRHENCIHSQVLSWSLLSSHHASKITKRRDGKAEGVAKEYSVCKYQTCQVYKKCQTTMHLVCSSFSAQTFVTIQVYLDHANTAWTIFFRYGVCRCHLHAAVNTRRNNCTALCLCTVFSEQKVSWLHCKPNGVQLLWPWT